MRGFDGGGFAVGEVYGVRWWSIREQGRDPVLRGAYGLDWTAGDNIAVCRGYGAVTRHKVPDEECGCGFWGYWLPASAPIAGKPRVMGVIKGWGDDTLIGDLGFRCGVARIVALCCEDIATRQVTDGPPTYVAGPPIPLPHQGDATFFAFGGRGTYRPDPRAMPRTEPDLIKQAEVEYRLGDLYQCAVYTTFDAMTTMHPLTRDYLPPAALPPPPPWMEELTRMHWNTPEEYQAALAKLTAEMAATEPDPMMPQTISGADALRKLIDRADLTGDNPYPIEDLLGPA